MFTSLSWVSLPCYTLTASLRFILRAYDCPRQEDFRDDSKFQDLKIRPFSEESSAPYHWMGKIPEFMNHDARMLEQSPKYFAFKQANWKCRCPVLSHWTPTEETKLACPCCFHQILRLHLDVMMSIPWKDSLVSFFLPKILLQSKLLELVAGRHDDNDSTRVSGDQTHPFASLA